MDFAHHAPAPEPLIVNTPSSVSMAGTQSVSEDLLERPVKRKRLLSDKQKAALRGGREKRWKKLHTHEENDENRDEVKPVDPKVAAFLNPDPTPDNSEESDASSVTLGSQDTSTEDEIVTKKQLKRATKKAKKGLPKAVRKRLDRYLRVKMEEQKFQLYPEPPVLTRQNNHYDAREYSTPYNGPFSQPLNYL